MALTSLEPVRRVIPAMKVPAALVLLAVVATAVAQLDDRGWWPSSVTQGAEFGTSRSTPRPTTPPRATTQAPSQQQPQQNCECPSPEQFQPVCGSNNQTYTNPQKLECARRCGITGLTIQYLGTCQNGR